MADNKPEDDRFERFWQIKASKYPLPFDDEALKTTNRVVSIVRSRGVIFECQRVLDIGCGTGIYTLPLALMAKSVTGIDFSEEMLRRLIAERDRLAIGNVTTIQSSWKELDIDFTGLRKAFDISLVSMSAAVKERDDIEKMEACAKSWCVYVGWGRKRRNSFMEDVYRRHGVAFEPPSGVKRVSAILDGLQRTYSLDFIDALWSRSECLDDTVQQVAAQLEVHGHEPKKEIIREVAGAYLQDGLVRHTTEVEQGIIVWRPL